MGTLKYNQSNRYWTTGRAFYRCLGSFSSLPPYILNEVLPLPGICVWASFPIRITPSCQDSLPSSCLRDFKTFLSQNPLKENSVVLVFPPLIAYLLPVFWSLSFQSLLGYKKHHFQGLAWKSSGWGFKQSYILPGWRNKGQKTPTPLFQTPSPQASC